MPASSAPQVKREWGWIIAAALGLLVGAAGLLQPPRPDPFAVVTPWTSAEWWSHPIERNAFKRLPAISGDLNDVFVAKDGKHIWAVGNGGMIVHSADSGKTWARQTNIQLNPSVTEKPGAGADSPPQGTIPKPPNDAPKNQKTSFLDRLIPSAQAQSADKGGAPANLPAKGNQYPAPENSGEGQDASVQQSLPELKQPVPAKTEIRSKQPNPPKTRSATNKTPSDGIPKTATPPSKNRDTANESSNDLVQQPVERKNPEAAPDKQSPESEGELTTNSIAAVHFYSVHFADANHGWAVGLGGTIIATVDGGNSWTAQVSGSKAWIFGVYFTDANHGWAVGSGGTIIFMPDDNMMLRKADGGTILATVDGGKSWTRQSSESQALLIGVHFTDANHGWAVGLDGTIIATADGGKSWTAQSSGSQALLRSVYFTDANHGWAVGDGGTIIATPDGGKNWTGQSSGSHERLSGVHFTDASHGWAVGYGGTIIATADGGKNWAAQGRRSLSPLNSVHFTDANHGWVVGYDGTIIATTDGGKSWAGQSSGSESGLRSVHFTDANHGWVVGDSGKIIATMDGGKSWARRSSGSNAGLDSVHFTDPNHGWAVGVHGIITTSDGGKSWTAQGGRSLRFLSSVHFADANHGWVVGIDGTIIATADGGKSWSRQLSGSPDTALSSVHFVDTIHGWAVGENNLNVTVENGPIIATVDGGKTWTAQSVSGQTALNSVYFTDANHGWAVGDGGTIIATPDGGKNWTGQSSGSHERLSGVHFTDASHGWAVGYGGTIIATADGGKSWGAQTSGTDFALLSIIAQKGGEQLCAVGAATILNSFDGGKTWEPIQYKRFPAPWIWLTWFASGLAGWRAWRRAYDSPPLEKERNIEDKGASDAPVVQGDQDRLNFEPVAKALAKFLQNQSTTAPLVLAVTGKWGTGKSSLMSLLASELRSKYRVRSVWFNAWHHQNEENLLAALLENIRQQAVPQLRTLHGVKFRVLLACARYRKRWISSSIWLAFFVAAIGYIYVAPNAGWAQFVAWIKMLTKDGSDLENVGALSGASGVALIAVAVKVFLSLRAFGVNPAALMATTANQFKLRDASAQAGFRFQFQREFEEVTTSLERIDKRMLIFIDDLDRCQPDKVIQILEAVNFLTSSGKCYVVLGMDRDYVERAVGLSFEKIAKEMAENDATNNEANAKLQRQEFARRYMKKLLNLEIPIPSLDPALAETLFDEQRVTQTSNGEAFEKISWRSQLVAWVRAQWRWAPLVGVLLVIVAAWLGGNKLGEIAPEVPTEKPAEKPIAKPGMPIQFEIENRPDGKILIVPRVAGDAKGSEAAAPPAKPEPNPTGKIEGNSKGPERSGGPAAFEKGQSAAVPWMIPIPLLVALALLLGYVLWRSQDAVVRDSEAFTRALNIWKRLVIAKSANPREIKRFQNRVRYFAMRLRDDRERKVVSPETQQSEAMLVALAALHHTEPRLLELVKKPNDLNLEQYDAVTSNEMPFISTFSDNDKKEFYTLWNLMRTCLKEHENAKLEWPPTSQLIERFKRWSDGIVT